jgi:predicted DNA-binding protein
MRRLSDTADGKAPMVGIRLPREQRERVIELAGPDRGALSEFVRAAIEAKLERLDGGQAGDGDE